MERYLFDDKELVAFNRNKGEFVVSHIPAMLFLCLLIPNMTVKLFNLQAPDLFL